MVGCRKADWNLGRPAGMKLSGMSTASVNRDLKQ